MRLQLTFQTVSDDEEASDSEEEESEEDEDEMDKDVDHSQANVTTYGKQRKEIGSLKERPRQSRASESNVVR